MEHWAYPFDMAETRQVFASGNLCKLAFEKEACDKWGGWDSNIWKTDWQDQSDVL